MAISFHKLCIVFISVFLLFFCLRLSHGLMSNRCRSHESQALLLFKASLNDSEGSLSSWVNGTDCCTHWAGISCDNHTNHVVSVTAFGASYYSYNKQYLFQGVISESLCQLRFLTSLTISGVYQGTTIPPCLGNLSYIEYLDLSSNSFSGTIPPLVCLLTRLKFLDLSSNNLNGSIPPYSCLANFSSLTYLILYDNQLSGSIPASLGNLSLLTDLRLAYNQIRGIIPDSLGNLSSLEWLSLGNNQLFGTIPPSFAQLSSLTVLHVDGNHYNETISSSSLPPSLIDLSLSLNYYQTISETFFHNLTSLNFLRLSKCVLNISTTWIPPFNLFDLSLDSCMIDAEFPAWISTQSSLQKLKLANASLMGVIPSWLWETSPLVNHLNLSGNNFEGILSSNISTWMQLVELDVSRNRLSGCIPSMWSSNISLLLLNDNLFSDNIPSSLGMLSKLMLLNLENNNVTGVIPPSLSNCSSLIVLNLGNNSLEGSLPQEFNKLSELYLLDVHSNKLHGSLPPSIVNCSKLQVLDIGNNLMKGEIPIFIGNLSSLRVLVMKENNFIGSIPLEIGQLKNLQILLLSSNHISGSIPHTIIFLQAMTNESQIGFILSPSQFFYQEGLHMTLKGIVRHYQYILSTLTSIDLSNNELEGKIPSNLGNLKGLRLLNLSMNNLNGTIPKTFGEMCQLDSLDLSRNHFSGQVPAELESLSYLGSLNLSNNNLSGSIPQGTHMTGFEESSYFGNPNLWGCPLPKNCSWPQFVPSPPPIYINKMKKSTKYPLYEIALGLSYGIAFGGTLSLILIKVSWRGKYFSKVDTLLKFLFPWVKNMTL